MAIYIPAITGSQVWYGIQNKEDIFSGHKRMLAPGLRKDNNRG
jgi:hypothetical protein